MLVEILEEIQLPFFKLQIQHINKNVVHSISHSTSPPPPNANMKPVVPDTPWISEDSKDSVGFILTNTQTAFEPNTPERECMRLIPLFLPILAALL